MGKTNHAAGRKKPPLTVKLKANQNISEKKRRKKREKLTTNGQLSHSKSLNKSLRSRVKKKKNPYYYVLRWTDVENKATKKSTQFRVISMLKKSYDSENKEKKGKHLPKTNFNKKQNNWRVFAEVNYAKLLVENMLWEAPQKKSRAIEEEKKAWDEKKVKQTSKLSYLVKGFIHESGQCIDNWTRAEIQECHLGHRNYGKGHQITSELGQATKTLTSCKLNNSNSVNSAKNVNHCKTVKENKKWRQKKKSNNIMRKRTEKNLLGKSSTSTINFYNFCCFTQARYIQP